IEICPLLQPRPQRGRLLAHAILHIDALRLVAREGDIEPRQQAVAAIAIELGLVEEVRAPALIAEEQPVAPGGAARSPLLEKGAEGRHAGARPDHDDRRVVGGGEAEAMRWLDEDRHPGAARRALGEEGRGDAFARPAALL